MKKYFYVIALFCCMFFCLEVVKAGPTGGGPNTDETGQGSSIFKKCSTGWNWNYFCREYNIKGVRFSFIYYDGKNYELLGHTRDYYKSVGAFNPINFKRNGWTWNSKINMRSSLTLGDYGKGANIPYDYQVVSDMPVNGTGEVAYWNKKLWTDCLDSNKHVIAGSFLDKLAIDLTGCSLSNPTGNCWNKKSEFAVLQGQGDISKVGYRIIMEPIRIYYGRDKEMYVMTPTEYASTVWNIPGGTQGTGKTQVGIYLHEEERIFTKYDDIGIYKTAKCTDKNHCLASDFQFEKRKGHALHIYDISEAIQNQCNYETGEGFPPPYVTREQLGRNLTKEEEKCCKQYQSELDSTYPELKPAESKCMKKTGNVPDYAACLFRALSDDAKMQKLAQEKSLKYSQFKQKYPACFDGNNIKIVCKYIAGTYFGTTGNVVSREQYLKECGRDLGRQCKVVTDGDSTIYYGKNGNVVDKETYEIECKDAYFCKIMIEDGKKVYYGKNGKKVSESVYNEQCNYCDETNPNHFPQKGDKHPDLTCCLFFEDQMRSSYKEEAIDKFGMSGSALEQYVNNQVHNWFYAPGYEFRQNCFKCDINSSTLTPECCDELREEYPDKPEEFWIGKGCAPEEKCKWKDYEVSDLGNVNTGKNCEFNTSLKSEDSDNWECIFESDNIKPGSSTETFKDYYLKYSNPYCSVYCREVVQYDFPDDKMVTRAGNHFTVGNTGKLPEWAPVKFTSTRECKTNGSTRNNNSTSINTAQFEQDWKVTNDRVVSTWDAWKIAEQQDYAYSHSSQGARDCDWTCTSRCPIKCGENGCTGGGCCSGYYKGYTMYPASVSYASYGQGSQNVTPSTWCSTLGHPDPNSDLKKKAHEQAKKDLDNIERDISSCTSFENFGTYRYATFDHSNVKSVRYSKYNNYADFLNYKEFSPDLTINYDEPTYDDYSYHDQLKKKEKSVVSDHNFSTSGSSMTVKYQCTEQSAPYKTTCTKNQIFDYSSQSETHAIYTKTVDYSLKNNVFNVILKPQGIAVMGKEKGSDSDQVYIDLGYSALHNHFMTPSGRYAIGLSYTKFTPATGNNNHTHNFDQFLSKDEKNYSCKYRVINEIIENKDPKCEGDNCIACGSDNCLPETLRGLNLIYRTIDLGDPFPGVLGTGREAGSNWKNKDDVKNYITNNRNSKEDRMYYDKAPMYQITLTPVLIKKIRKYNDKTNFNDFHMDCLESNGRECKSDFIRGKLEGNNDNFSSHFATCDLSGGKGSTKCCGVGNWDDCDAIDGITRKK